MCDKKTFLIGVLTLSAAILTAGHLELSSTARASETVMDNDYQLITANITSGNDGLYVLDKRNNLVVLFTWDLGKRSLTPRDVKSLDTLLAGG